eukprot:m.203823 g.203823  ORF g.203823 m.203823 type:complete len:1374 (-) comp17738_c0_seq1:129-4250(-)
MGNQVITAPAQVLDMETYLLALAGHSFEEGLRSTRFLKTARMIAKGQHRVVKTFVKLDTTLDLHVYLREFMRIKEVLGKVVNALPYSGWYNLERAAFLVRAYVAHNLYDRLNTRPFLNSIEKRWIAFQILKALEGSHKDGLAHGDVKIENVLVTSSNWVFLSDYAPFKPTLLPDDNPAAFSFFFDTSGRQSCNIAPERFYTPTHADDSETQVCKYGQLMPAMDVFSVGCTIAELFVEGKFLFTLSSLIAYKEGKYSPAAVLDLIPHDGVRELVAHMINPNPALRRTVSEYLFEFTGNVFPAYFETFLHPELSEFCALYPMTSDQKILSLQGKWPNIDKQLSGQPEQDNAFVIIAGLVCSCVRSLTLTSAKLACLDLLLALSLRIGDEYKLDRILPYFVFLLGDSIPLVKATAIRTMTQMLNSVKTVRPIDVNLFPEYIIKGMRETNEDETIVKVAFAANIADLASCAKYFLEQAQLSNPVDDQEQDTFESHDNELNDLRDLFQEDLVLLLNDPESIVKQTLLAHNMDKLCTFLGPKRTSNFLLLHMLTFFNDKLDWHLRVAFVDSITVLATYIGGRNFTDCVLPLLEKGLSDSEEFVTQHTLMSLKELIDLRMWDADTVRQVCTLAAPLLYHPGEWIRYSAVAFFANVARTLDAVDRNCTLLPCIESCLAQPLFSLDDPLLLLSTLKPPVARQVFQTLSDSPIVKEILSHLLVRATNSQAHPSPSIEQAMIALRELGMDDVMEAKLLFMEDHILKVHEERQRYLEDLQSKPLPVSAGPAPLRKEWISEVDVSQPVDTAALRPMRPRTQTVASGVPSSGSGTQRMGPGEEEMSSGHAEVEKYIRTKRNQYVARSTPDVTATTTSIAQSTRRTKPPGGPAVPETPSWRPDGKLMLHLHEHKGAVNSIVVSNDNKFFATGADDGTVKIWDCQRLVFYKGTAPRSRMTYTAQGGRIVCLAMVGRTTVASASDNGSLHLLDVDHAAKNLTAQKPNFNLRDDGCIVDMHHIPQFPGNEAMLAFSTVGGSIHGCDMRDKSLAWKIQNCRAQGLVQAFYPDPNGNWLILGTSRGVYTVWDLRFMMPVKSWLDPRRQGVLRLANYPTTAQPFVPGTLDNSSLLLSSVSGSNEVAIWDVRTSHICGIMRAARSQVEAEQQVLEPHAPLYSKQSSASDISSILPPRPAFEHFQRVRQRQERQANPDASSKSLSLDLQREWESLPSAERQPFLESEQADIERFEDQITAYLNSKPKLEETAPDVGGIRALVSPPYGSIVITGGSDRTIRVWDMAQPEQSFVLGEAQAATGGTASTPSSFKVEDRDRIRFIQEIEGNLSSRTVAVPQGPAAASVFHHDTINNLAVVNLNRPILLSGSRDGVVKVWR